MKNNINSNVNMNNYNSCNHNNIACNDSDREDNLYNNIDDFNNLH